MKSEADAEPRTLLRHGADAYAQALATAGGKQLETQMRQGARTAVCAAIYASPPYNLTVPPLAVARLSVNLTRARVSGGVEGERQRFYEAPRYSTFLVPAGVPTKWQKEAPSRHVNIYFHPEALDNGSDGGALCEAHGPVCNVQVVGIRQLTDQLAQELDTPGPWNAEAADSLARLLLVRFARHLRQPGTSTNPLTQKTMKSLRDYIAANLSERILVADLAREASLSTNRFAQAFSEHARQTPHQFVLELRLERAMQLLRGSSINVAEVAHDCGFANQQHLCNAMRRMLGTTPIAYRSAHKRDG